MNFAKSIGLHVALTLLAGTTAMAMWTQDEEPVKAATAEVRVWAGSPEQLQSVSFEGKELKVRLAPKKDELGTWYVVHLDKMERKASRPHNPHNPHNPPPEEPEAKEPGKWVKSKFVSVKEGNLLAETLAPLHALRAIGPVGKDRDEEFGFDEPEGTLTVKIGGTEHKLTVGGLTPGGGDRYVRLVGSGEAYAVPGEALRGVLHPESRLLESELHGFAMDDVRRLKVSAGNASRELLRLTSKPNAWASLDAPMEQDETASNWMNKVQRLRISKYLEAPPKNMGQDSLVLRLEYLDAKNTLGFLELFKVPSEPGDESKDRYLVRTEHTRWYGEVLGSTAEQVERDVQSVVSSKSESSK